ncbi:MAG: hypothetical protein M1832_004459 [Thelocarpon impressellum]|nr:MAG: hypothetical protein M1832_004459 [Thelocarpon impressellum]
MATLAPMPARQPFGLLAGDRLQNLQNVKNSQNALPTTAVSSPVKRRHAPSIFDDEDGENVDPAVFGSKRAKNGDGSTSKFHLGSPSKAGRFILTDAPPSPDLSNPVKAAMSSSTKRATRVPVSRLHKSTPTGALRQNHNPARPTATPATAPPAAGRSPKHKRIGLLSRKRTSSPFTRIDPPAKHQGSAPLSIDAALSGTISGYNAPKVASQPPALALHESVPMSKDWFFDIHEDTLEDTLTNLMEFSTSALDISDDEGRRRERSDRGKENIPPNSLPVDDAALDPTPAAGSRPMKAPRAPRPKRTTNPFSAHRTPLADLAPEDFYDDGALSSPSFLAATKKSTSAVEFKEPALPAALKPKANPFSSGAVSRLLSDVGGAPPARAGSEWPCSSPPVRRAFRGDSPDKA